MNNAEVRLEVAAVCVSRFLYVWLNKIMYFYALLTAKNMALFVSSDVLQAVFCNCFCRHTSRTVDSPKSILSGTRAKKKKKKKE